MEYYSAIKKNEILATWMNLLLILGIKLRIKLDSDRQTLSDITCVESKKYNKLVNKAKIEADSQIQRTN